MRSMRVLLPRRVSHWVTLGLMLVVLPLVAATLTAIHVMDEIATESQLAVERSTKAVSYSRTLADFLMRMERNARVYRVVQEKSLLDNFSQLHEGFEATAANLLATETEQALLDLLSDLLAQERQLYQSLISLEPNSEQAAEALSGFSELREQLRALINLANEESQRQGQRLLSYANQAQSVLLWEALMVIPIASMLGVLMMARVIRPMRHLDRSIRELGAGNNERVIQVEGPEDIRLLGERLEWLRQRIVELGNQKRIFLQHISHELKTPLASLREGIGLLGDGVTGELNEQQRDVVNILENSSVHLQSRIEDLLAFSISDQPPDASARERFDLKPVIEDVLQQQQLPCQSKSLIIRADLEPTEIFAEREKIATVVDNLLSNAIKFSPENGCIEIELDCRKPNAFIRVTDEGPGIRLEDREAIFQPFFQADTEYTGYLKGTGLGLAIARMYARMHRGDVVVENTERVKGSSFLVELPVASAIDTGDKQ